MTERQIALYEYLVRRGNAWTPQDKIARELFSEYGNGECFIEPKDYHNTNERSRLTRDLREINLDPSFQKIIIASGKGVKVATEEEFNRFIASQYKAAIRKLARIYKMAKKGNLNGQIDFGGHTVEAFLERCDK